MSQNPIDLSYRLAHPTLGCSQQLTQMLLCSMNAQDIQLTERPPLTLMLCVDTSGSMMGRPLELVIESIRMIVEQLNDNDRLGMVTFSNRARLISTIRTINQQGRSFFHGVLSGIQAMGSTHMENGLQLALEHMPETKDGELSHIVLFSDGKPNRGELSPRALSTLIKNKRNNITLSSFGFGLKHDEDLLQQLARTGKGGYAYIESPDTVPLAFAKELGSLFSVVGTQVQLLLRPTSGCSILGLRGTQQMRYTERGLTIDLPDLIAGQTFHLLMKVQFDTPDKVGQLRFSEMELRYTLTGKTPQEISCVKSLFCDVVKDPKIEMDPFVSTRVLLQDIAEKWEQAHHYAIQKKYDLAISELSPLLPRLQMALHKKANEDEIRNWYEQIVDEVAILSERPDEERYQKIRKAAKSEMSDPTGIFRRSNTSIINLNTTQRNLLGDLMLKAVGMPHAYIKIVKTPSKSPVKTGEIFPILGEVSIGRMGQIKLEHTSVSKRHVRLVATPKGYLLIDLLSSTAPLVNDEKVLAPTNLNSDDLIQIGDFQMTFHMGLAPHLKNASHLQSPKEE